MGSVKSNVLSEDPLSQISRLIMVQLAHMNEIVPDKFNSLKEFIERIDEYEKEQHLENDKNMVPVYRGQESSKWGLETSLERYSKKEFSIRDYNYVLMKIAPSIYGHTGKRWEIKDCEVNSPKWSPQNQEFMVYLRHFSFPSPLLDWSKSIYIALFFAFFKADVSNENGTVAIYACTEYELITFGSADGLIYLLGPYPYTDKRHFTQQSRHTIAVKEKNEHWCYCPHNEPRAGTCEIKRWELPIRLRDEVMKLLEKMNITPYSIYGNEESLMQALAFEHLK